MILQNQQFMLLSSHQSPSHRSLPNIPNQIPTNAVLNLHPHPPFPRLCISLVAHMQTSHSRPPRRYLTHYLILFLLTPTRSSFQTLSEMIVTPFVPCGFVPLYKSLQPAPLPHDLFLVCYIHSCPPLLSIICASFLPRPQNL